MAAEDYDMAKTSNTLPFRIYAWSLLGGGPDVTQLCLSKFARGSVIHITPHCFDDALHSWEYNQHAGKQDYTVDIFILGKLSQYKSDCNISLDVQSLVLTADDGCLIGPDPKHIAFLDRAHLYHQSWGVLLGPLDNDNRLQTQIDQLTAKISALEQVVFASHANLSGDNSPVIYPNATQIDAPAGGKRRRSKTKKTCKLYSR